MKPLFTNKEFDLAKANDKLPCKCYQCDNNFLVMKKFITYAIKHDVDYARFCSKSCQCKSRITKEQVTCSNCNRNFNKTKNQLNRSKNHFCSCTCSVSYNNKYKTHGNRRSKLEKWLQEQLTILYPNLDIHYNQKLAINSELDIYIPSLNLAFELNGIFHYEPIYGINKLKQTKLNDISKTKACHDVKIDLCVIDTSGQKYFKPATSYKYLVIINTILKSRL